MHLISLFITIFLQRTQGMIHFVFKIEKSNFIRQSQEILFIPPHLAILFSPCMAMSEWISLNMSRGDSLYGDDKGSLGQGMFKFVNLGIPPPPTMGRYTEKF